MDEGATVPGGRSFGGERSVRDERGGPPGPIGNRDILRAGPRSRVEREFATQSLVRWAHQSRVNNCSYLLAGFLGPGRPEMRRTVIKPPGKSRENRFFVKPSALQVYRSDGALPVA